MYEGYPCPRFQNLGKHPWASLCGGEEAGIYDDYAFEHGAEVYQKVLDFGTSIIQTDRPELLISYLKKIGRHD